MIYIICGTLLLFFIVTFVQERRKLRKQKEEQAKAIAETPDEIWAEIREETQETQETTSK